MDELKNRVLKRFFDDEVKPSNEAVEEFLLGVTDRLLIQLDVDDLPKRAESIVVEATVAAIRLRGFEGMASESASDGGSLSNSFVADVLEKYSDDIAAIKRSLHPSGINFMR